jgi:hypothetical protein
MNHAGIETLHGARAKAQQRRFVEPALILYTYSKPCVRHRFGAVHIVRATKRSVKISSRWRLD